MTTKRKPKKGMLYLLVYVGPTGFDWVEAKILDRPPKNLYAVGKGEGQTLLFKLADWDCSPEFARALRLGEVAEDFAGRRFKFSLRGKG